MRVKELKTIIKEYNHPEIIGMYYNLSEVFINYVANPNQIFEIRFKNVAGFRCLDEGDLTSYWGNKDLSGKWLIEITEGGWQDSEYVNGNCIISKQDSEIREFLIMSENDCISILSTDDPEIAMTLHNNT
jgi:hypothetical protein